MKNQDIDKIYFSPIDKFLYTYDRDHAKSASQIKEIQKHERIARLRDVAEERDAQGEIWKDF